MTFKSLETSSKFSSMRVPSGSSLVCSKLAAAHNAEDFRFLPETAFYYNVRIFRIFHPGVFTIMHPPFS